VKLLIQPDDGIAALLSGIRNAKKSIEIAIFRFDRAEMEAGMKAAVGRGVSVSVLIATPTGAARKTCANSRCACSKWASPFREPPTIWCAITTN
jgi:hypothetical protein